jgi:uncharacterized cupin superfamily protein
MPNLRCMVPEAPLEQTDAGLAPTGEGWFVVNARDARWRERPGRGFSLALTGSTDFEAETFFKQLGVNLAILSPGEPISIYHWETDQEGFLVLYGEALLLVEGQERTLRQWDYVHSPPGTNHAVIGAGDGPCAVLALGSRQFMATDEWGGYSTDELARRHGVGAEEDTPDPEAAYARFRETTFTPYREGWLPDE